jgi:AhpD family alkylhydroperoxidase
MMKTMATSPAVLKGYLDFASALGGAAIGVRTQELIALTIAEANSCDYCLSAHTTIGGLIKIPAAELDAARDCRNADSKVAAILRFARIVVEMRGNVTDGDVEALRHAGASDAEIAEVVAIAALNVFTNLFNNVAATAVDFPRVSARLAAAA